MPAATCLLLTGAERNPFSAESNKKLILNDFFGFGIACGTQIGTLPMRLPHNLVRNPSGRSVFRLRVPRSLQALTKRLVIKHALCTTDARLAQQQALGLAARYAQLFEQLGWQGMPKPPKPEEILASVQANGLSRYELDLQTGLLKTDGPEDHALAMDALARIGSVGFLAHFKMRR
ncbi:DUF6538 domain-containing protein [Pseudoxanthomonas composti]|uniref:DUF6538 domain-containing protein n=1 Tax=Pseudoxanthomonas composti TaxID=2137479 RepID=A0A4Q1JVS2_9GAMM|nr:DUF6538 domain-containing protein [Pseudoxanthomonas composti]RXR06363.1 hypothetical protein EPA99_06835 [Pseudoxanthomonas composti]